MPLSLSNTIGFAQFPLLKGRELWEYQWKYLIFFIFFRQKTHFLGIRGGMLKMTILQKKIISLRRFFETNLDFINHPLQDFWNFPPTFPQYFQIFSQISIFGEFRYLCLKFGTFSINIHGEKCFQSCTLFGSFFNFHIVQCRAICHYDNVTIWQSDEAYLCPTVDIISLFSYLSLKPAPHLG